MEACLRIGDGDVRTPLVMETVLAVREPTLAVFAPRDATVMAAAGAEKVVREPLMVCATVKELTVRAGV